MKNLLTVLIILLISEMFVLVGCSSNPLAEDRELDHPINFAGDQSEKLGIRDDKVIFQKRITLEARLHFINNHIYELQEQSENVWNRVKACKMRLSDIRIGGTGTAPKIQPWQSKIEANDNYKYVYNAKSNSIFAITEEELNIRINRFEKYESYLSTLLEELHTKNDECAVEYSTALSNHGLNVADTESHGEWVNGEWKLVTPSTYDPEELARRKHTIPQQF